MTYPNLTSIKFNSSVIDEENLARFLRSQSPALRSLRLWNIYLLCGRWINILKILPDMTNLEELALGELHERVSVDVLDHNMHPDVEYEFDAIGSEHVRAYLPT